MEWQKNIFGQGMAESSRPHEDIHIPDMKIEPVRMCAGEILRTRLVPGTAIGKDAPAAAQKVFLAFTSAQTP